MRFCILLNIVCMSDIRQCSRKAFCADDAVDADDYIIKCSKSFEFDINGRTYSSSYD